MIYIPPAVSGIYLAVKESDVESKRLSTVLSPDGDALAIVLLGPEGKPMFGRCSLRLVPLNDLVASPDGIGDSIVQHFVRDISHESPLSRMTDPQP